MAGMGLSFISMHTVMLELATGKLVTLNVSGLPVVRDWFVIHLRDKKLSPIARAFRAFLLEQDAPIIEGAGSVALSQVLERNCPQSSRPPNACHPDASKRARLPSGARPNKPSATAVGELSIEPPRSLKPHAA
jgi:LysR substrate binding domain-containing protein